MVGDAGIAEASCHVSVVGQHVNGESLEFRLAPLEVAKVAVRSAAAFAVGQLA